MVRLVRAIPLISLLAGAAACSSSSGTTPPPEDAGIHDASPSDATLGDANDGSALEDGAATDACSGDACGPVVVNKLTQTTPNKIDLVLVVDNSATMADKQYILSLAIPNLVSGLVNPLCIDSTTNQAITAGQPTDPTVACPAGSAREFPPIEDIHIGLLSSSLGSFGADGCPDKPPAACAVTPNSTSNDDHGHLVTRSDPCGQTNVPTYQNLGFLAWDPAQKLTPPGTQAVGDLTTAVTNLVVGDGALGCGFASQDESWYRFLVDPTPYQSISLVDNQVQTTGTDTALLAQRKAFLRPDSLLAIVDFTDKSDSSIKEYSSYPLFAAPELHLPHPSSACNFGTANPTPNDPCCYSCGQSPPAGCTADPKCSSSPNYTSADEDTSLRALGLISHKSRYGIEFFYPPSRYVSALTSPTVTDATGATVPNPVYSNLDPTNDLGAVRDPGLVVYAAVVGAPWQLIARPNSTGVPDLINGVSPVDSAQVGGFKTAGELSLTDSAGNVFWDDIAGNPESYVAANSPFMQESTVPRSGTDPITGAAISPTTTPDGTGSTVGGSLLNDHEYTIKSPPDEIEYSCVFDLPAGHTKDCTTGVPCQCPSNAAATTDNPLCDPNTPTTQVKAAAYPGIKELAIARGMGTQGVAASICPKQLTDASAADYGYAPAIQTIVNRVKQTFYRGQCLPDAHVPDASGQVACTILEATNVGSSACTCDASQSRAPVSAAHMSIEAAAEADPLDATAKWNCFCEIDQLAGSALSDCETNERVMSSTNGWCYVGAELGAAQSAVVTSCPSSEPHEIRLVGTGAAQSGSTIFMNCGGP